MGVRGHIPLTKMLCPTPLSLRKYFLSEKILHSCTFSPPHEKILPLSFSQSQNSEVATAYMHDRAQKDEQNGEVVLPWYTLLNKYHL